jgi:hypothetical protein
MMRRFIEVLAACAFLVGVGSCDSQKRLRRGPDGIIVTITQPGDLGTPERPIMERRLVFDLDVVDLAGNPVDEDLDINAYVQVLGTLTPNRDAFTAPLQTIRLVAGAARGVTIMLPDTYGPTVLWFEDTGGDRLTGTFASGASAPIYYPFKPYPTPADINLPPDENGADRNERSRFEGQQVRIEPLAGSKLVVTAVYTQSYNVSEVSPDGTTPPYGHVYVYSFQRPPVKEGQILHYVTGGVTEFNGQTEITFPRAEAIDRSAPVPRATPVNAMTIKDTLAMEKVEGGLIQLANVKVCPLDSTYEMYQQWSLDIGNGCTAKSLKLNIVTAGAVRGYDPPPPAGTTLACVTGTLRNVAIGDFVLWLLFPRRTSDIVATGSCPQ